MITTVTVCILWVMLSIAIGAAAHDHLVGGMLAAIGAVLTVGVETIDRLINLWRRRS